MSLAPKLTPADARVDWKLPAHLIDRQLRACTPDPGAWTEFDAGPHEALARHPGGRRRAGVRRPRAGARGARVDRNAVYAGTGTVPVRLGDVQPQGKRRMPAADWARGLRPRRMPPSSRHSQVRLT